MEDKGADGRPFICASTYPVGHDEDWRAIDHEVEWKKVVQGKPRVEGERGYEVEGE